MWTTLVVLFLAAAAPKFYPDDPIVVDRDDLPIEKPGVIELSPTYDALFHSFARRKLEGPVPRAQNVNTLGEVPDSSWFTNRIGVREMSLDELTRGPAGHGDAPDASLPFTIVAAKASGITPGFTVRDARGRTYFVKFDPEAHPNLTTGADLVSTGFFHAIGYNVPASFLVHLRLEDLVIDPRARVRLEGNVTAPMGREFLERMLDSAAARADGAVRAIFSLAVPGEPIGPFTFIGTRPDDPNDIVPHEDRRELRGYRVFCAWLNHDDSRAINTLDTFVSGDGGTGHVRHYLIDFGSTLGSGSDRSRRIAPQDPRAGNEYIVDFDNIWKAAYSFGIVDRAWRKFRYVYPEHAEIGRIEADFFDPGSWKPEYPNPAFDRMLADDAFWAAKIVARFSDDAIRALVATGEYSSRDAHAFLSDVIIRRRDKIVAHYFRGISPFDDFSVGTELTFRNLGEERGLGRVEGYEYEWFAYDNETGDTTSLGGGRVGEARIPVVESESRYVMVRIRGLAPTEPSWTKAVEVYLRRGGEGALEIAGVDRDP